MLNKNLLWSRTIGSDGSVDSEPTFLGAVIIVLTGAAISIALFYVVLWLAALWQISGK